MERKNVTKPFIIAGHQPHYLPWIGYFNKIYQSDAFCLVDSIQFNKKWFQSRNKILTKNGKLWLSVPVKTGGKFYQNICDVEIDNRTPWKRKHWKTIRFTYEKTPYFQLYKDFFEDVYQREWNMLVDLNEHIIRGVLAFLHIDKKIVRTSTFHPEGKKTTLLIDMCRKMNADGYLSGTGNSHQYINDDAFRNANLIHRFQQFTHPVYPQMYGEFQQKMAIIDLLFNCGPKSEQLVKQTGQRES